MLLTAKCINVYSELNPWIDFMVYTYDDDFEKAKEIIKKSFDNWWEDEMISQIPIGSYIEMKLKENGIEYDIYYKNKEEEEE